MSDEPNKNFIRCLAFYGTITPTNSQSFCMAILPRVSQNLRSSYVSHVTAATKKADENWYLHRPGCRNTLNNAHTTSRTLQNCDISLGSLYLRLKMKTLRNYSRYTAAANTDTQAHWKLPISLPLFSKALLLCRGEDACVPKWRWELRRREPTLLVWPPLPGTPSMMSHTTNDTLPGPPGWWLCGRDGKPPA
jgi:hypothetical protein